MLELDLYLKRLMDGIYRQGLLSCANIIIISDHGKLIPISHSDVSATQMSGTYITMSVRSFV